MNLDDFFDSIYCINLDERTDRWLVVQDEFRKINLKNVQRFSAIRHDQGYLGCKASHLSIIKKAINNKNKNILIFEDDVFFVQKNLKILSECLIQLTDVDWDLFYLGATIDPKRAKLNRVSKNLIKTNFAYTTHAYAINSSIFNLILDKAEDSKEIDVFYSKFITPKYNTLVVDPMLAIQRENYSNILKKNVNYNWMINYFEDSKKKNNID